MRQIIIITLFLSVIISQNKMDAIQPFLGFSGSQSLQTAIGNATVSAGETMLGYTSNPANLGVQRFSTLSSNLYNSNYSSNRDASASGFSSLYAILPMPVYQGSLVFGVGINKETKFSGAFNGDGYYLTEDGGIFTTSIGAAIEFSRHLYLGVDLKYYRGEYELFIAYDEFTDFLNPTYRGFGASIGFLQKYSPKIQFGGSLELPIKLKVSDRWVYSDLTDYDNSFDEPWEYKLKKPMTLHLGWSVNLPIMNFYYEMQWQDMSNLEFRSDNIVEADGVTPAEIAINNDIKNSFESTVSHHVGVAAHIPVIPLHLYGGFQYLPTAYDGAYDDDRQLSFSGGFSLMMNQQFSLHGSYVNYFWKQNDSNESYSQMNFGISLHY